MEAQTFVRQFELILSGIFQTWNHKWFHIFYQIDDRWFVVIMVVLFDLH